MRLCLQSRSPRLTKHGFAELKKIGEGSKGSERVPED